jgi:formyl-CoA transferase/CoA:oxalate CoA-transferase
MILADLGAEIIKVERPVSGDDTRAWGPPFIKGESAYFLCVNRNKKSVTLNLAKQKGREILYKLVEKCDVLLENFSPGVAERLGVDYETICRFNPRIVYCSISGFGQTGPYRERPAYDLIIQGMGGLMGITGESGKPPVRIGVALSDIGAGMYAAIGILAALIAQDRTGRGQWIDVSLLDSTVSWLTYMAANYFVTGEVPEKMGSAHPNIVPYQCFEAKDGKYLTLAVGNDALWRNFCKALDLRQIVDDSKFASNPERVRNRHELIANLVRIFLEKPRDEWIQILLKAGVPCGPVYTLDEIFLDSQIMHRKMLSELEHPKAGKIKQIGIPMKFSESPVEIGSPPPLLSQHTKEILKSLVGCSNEELAQLKKEGII